MIAERKNLAALAARLTEAMAAEPVAPAPLPFPPPHPAAAPDLATADHDAGERIAMAAHYVEPPAKGLPPAERPDPLRDGLYRGFHAHRPAWDAMPYGAERGLAFAEARQDPGACGTCAGRRWWCEAGEPAAALRCTACHPPDHLPPEAVREVTT